MTTVTIYTNNNKIFYKEIQQEFSIIESPAGEIFWNENIDSGGPGAIKFWFRTINSTKTLSYILPDWYLIIDGIWIEKKPHRDIEDLDGKEVELRYKYYRFVFQFD